MTRRAHNGFSMVEVTLALGVMVFAVMTLLALLPAGVKTSRISMEETRAVFILTALEADLRNTHPDASGGKSLLFKLPLPYQWDADTGAYLLSEAAASPSAALSLNVSTVALDDREQVVTLSGGERARFQVSVIYLPREAADRLQAVQARLIVNWPALATADAADLTNPAKVSGFVETLVSFPAP